MEEKKIEWLWIEDRGDSFALEFENGVVSGCSPYYKRFYGMSLADVKSSLSKEAATREYYKSSQKFRKRKK